MQRRGIEAVLGQRLGDDIDVALAVAEHDGVLDVLGFADQAAQRLALGASRSPEGTSVCAIVVAAVAGRRPPCGSDCAGTARSAGVISGGIVAEKKSVWRLDGMQLADPLDVRDEAHVEHAVGFVDDEDLDPVSISLPRSKWSSRRPGVAISTSTPRSSFFPGRRKIRRRSAAPSSLLSLPYFRSCPRPGRRVRGSAQGSANAACAPWHGRGQNLDHRQGEGRRFAGAGLRDADNVAPLSTWGMPCAWMGVGVM